MRPSRVDVPVSALMKRQVYFVDDFDLDQRRATDGERWPGTLGREAPCSSGTIRVAIHLDGLVPTSRCGVTEHAGCREGEGDVFGSQLVTVVEFDTLSQSDFNGAVVNALPTGRQTRHWFQFALKIATDEQLDIRVQDALADIGLLGERIECVARHQFLNGNDEFRTVFALSKGDTGAGRRRRLRAPEICAG